MKASIKYLFLSAFISITLLSVAHEYWIAPVKYKVKSKEAFSVNCYVGEDFKEEVWAISNLGNNFTKLHMGKTLETIFATFTKLEPSKFNPRLQD